MRRRRLPSESLVRVACRPSPRAGARRRGGPERDLRHENDREQASTHTRTHTHAHAQTRRHAHTHTHTHAGPPTGDSGITGHEKGRPPSSNARTSARGPAVAHTGPKRTRTGPGRPGPARPGRVPGGPRLRLRNRPGPARAGPDKDPSLSSRVACEGRVRVRSARPASTPRPAGYFLCATGGGGVGVLRPAFVPPPPPREGAWKPEQNTRLCGNQQS